MILWIIIVLLSIWLAIGLLVYATFLPFIETLGSIKSYNIAYYWAISSIERAQLVIGYRDPWFIWSGGWIANTNFWAQSDFDNEDMWQLSYDNNHMYWTIDSRATTIPKAWEANVPIRFKENSNDHFNTLQYNQTEWFFLEYDNTTNPAQYYSSIKNIWKDLWILGTEKITLALRLNPFLYTTWFNLSPLCQCDQDKDWSNDDVLLTRSLSWKRDWKVYRINPNENLDVSKEPSNPWEWSTYLRESHLVGIPPSKNFIFDDSRNPTTTSADNPNILYYKLIASDNILSWTTFRNLFARSDTSNNVFQFSLINKLQTINEDIYPFLEYSIDFDWANVSNKYYSIKWVWRIWSYEVSIKLYKPILSKNTSSDFTVIF